MARFELVRCRLAIQCRVGYFPDGRERHRTFSLRDVRPDASADALASVVRAVAPLLAYPITKVRIVKKYVLMLDAAEARSAARRVSRPDTDRVGGRSLFERPSSHTTVRTDPYTAVQRLACRASYFLDMFTNPSFARRSFVNVVDSIPLPAILQ